MKSIEEIKNVLIDQVEKLNDDSILGDEEEQRKLIERSKAISQIAASYSEISKLEIEEIRARNEEKRMRVEQANALMNMGINFTNVTAFKTLGIEE